MRVIILGLITLVSPSCFSKNYNSSASYQTLVEQHKNVLPHLTEVCPGQIVNAFKIFCNQNRVSVFGSNNKWSSTFDGKDFKVFLLTRNFLLATSLFEGSLSFMESRIIDINTGHVLMDNDGGIVFADRETAVFAPTGPAIGHFSYAPTLYYFDFKTKTVTMLNYKILPRKNCGVDENDVTLTRSVSDVYIKNGQVIFPRQDNCGPFYYSSPIRGK